MAAVWWVWEWLIEVSGNDIIHCIYVSVPLSVLVLPFSHIVNHFLFVSSRYVCCVWVIFPFAVAISIALLRLKILSAHHTFAKQTFDKYRTAHNIHAHVTLSLYSATERLHFRFTSSHSVHKVWSRCSEASDSQSFGQQQHRIAL